MARLPNFLVIIRSEKLSGKGQGRGCLGVRKKERFVLGKRTFRSQKSKHFVLRIIDVRQLLDNQWKIYCIRVSDKFGDNGITGAVFIADNSIENILLSCRILGKGIETAFIKFVFKLLVEDGVSALEAKFIPTLKNRQVADFYDRLGFSVMRVEEGVKYYMANIDKLDLSIPDYYSITVKQ